MCELVNLPDSVLGTILSFLDADATIKFASTCKRMYQMLSDDYHVWKSKCRQFVESQPNEWGLSSYMLLYSKLLRKYGDLFGLWAAQDSPFGGLLLIRPEPPIIKASSVIVFRLNGPVLLRPVFEVTVDSGLTKVTCIQNKDANGVVHHEAELKRIVQMQDVFGFNCCEHGCRHVDLDPLLRHTGRLEALENEAPTLIPLEGSESGTNVPDLPENLATHNFFHFMVIHSRYFLSHHPQPFISLNLQDVSPSSTYYRRLSPLARNKVHPLQGLWRGTYGLHGIELVLIRPADTIQALAAQEHELSSQPSTDESFDSSEPDAGLPISVDGASDENAIMHSASSLPLFFLEDGHQDDEVLESCKATSTDTFMDDGSMEDAQEPGPYLEGLKITGDINVPAGQLSFQIDASAPYSTPFEQPGNQFTVPLGYRSPFGPSDAPNLIVQEVYAAWGQVADTDFHGPQWIPAELIVFSPDCFGLLWHQLSIFSVFTRVHLPAM